MTYFQLELKKQLKAVRMRLTEFKASRSVFSNSNQNITRLAKIMVQLLLKIPLLFKKQITPH